MIDFDTMNQFGAAFRRFSKARDSSLDHCVSAALKMIDHFMRSKDMRLVAFNSEHFDATSIVRFLKKRHLSKERPRQLECHVLLDALYVVVCRRWYAISKLDLNVHEKYELVVLCTLVHKSIQLYCDNITPKTIMQLQTFCTNLHNQINGFKNKSFI